MKTTHRRAAAAVGLFVLPLAGARAVAQQQPLQRGAPPNQDTPYILVTAFNNPDKKLRVEAGDELRRRLQTEHSAKELYVVPKNIVEANLTSSGYPPDSSLSPTDLMELSKQLRGEYAIDGKATRLDGKGVRLEARILLKTGQVTLAQPLPPAEGKDAGDAAKILEKSISEALKSVKPYKDCIASLRASKYDEAEKNARVGIAAYSNSSLNRVCLLQAQTSLKAPADSIVATATSILTVDPANLQALANLVDAYKAKGDTSKAIETNIRIWRLDPTNQSIAQSIIGDLANSGAPEKALPIVDTLLKDNPSDTALLKVKWKLQYRAGQFKNVLATGQELLKADPAAGDLDFYNRQVAAAQNDSNATAIREWATKASEKFPKEPSFPQLISQGYFKANQPQQALEWARKAAQINPKDANGWLLAVAAANQLGQPDTVMAIGLQALAAGVDKASIGPSLAGIANTALQKAQASKTREDWEASLKTAQLVDSIAATDQSKFFVGVSAFQVGLDALQKAQELAKDKGKTAKESRAKACSETKVTEDMWATAQMSIPRGASVSKETAGQLMSAIQQYSSYIPQMKTAYCGK